MRQVLVVADRGRVRLVKFKEAGEDPVDQEHLVEDSGARGEEHPPTRGGVVTDQSGRFGRNAAPGEKGGMSYGEDHNLTSELERQTLQKIAGMIGKLLSREGHPAWMLAAPQPILRRLEEALPRECREKLRESVGADLTKEPIAKLEKRFLGGG